MKRTDKQPDTPKKVEHSLSHSLNKSFPVQEVDVEGIFFRRTGRKLKPEPKRVYPKRLTNKRIMQQPWDEKFINDFIREVGRE